MIKQIGNFKVSYREFTADEAVLGISFDKDIFFSQIPEYTPAPNHIIIDVGAHIGAFSLLAASKVPQGKVYAIEASEESYTYLCINAAQNNANIIACHLALTDKTGTCTLYHDKEIETWGHSIVKEFSPAYVKETVICSTLKDFLDSNNIARCNFIKFNCEGAEFPILLSSPEYVLKQLDYALISYHRDLINAYTESDIMQHFINAGFETRLFKKSYESPLRGWIVAKNKQI
ncbi:MAG: FkbM family methyltransferase [Chlamydiota bacterium]|nr:FkbM family methyltransferase [Chlamydiota bacterium]